MLQRLVKTSSLFMKKLIVSIALNFILILSFAQKTKRVSTYFLANYNTTLYDYTIGNNPWGMGIGFQVFLNNSTWFKPTLEFTGDVYLEDDKVLRPDPDGSLPKTDNSFGGMLNLFAGSSFHPSEKIYVSLLAGPNFIGDQTLLGIKPSLGFYFSQRQSWTGKISYINIVNRTKLTGDDFGSLSFALGFKLF